MKTATHTPTNPAGCLPLRVSNQPTYARNLIITSAKGVDIGSFSLSFPTSSNHATPTWTDDEAKAFAAFAVHAVNAYEGLRADAENYDCNVAILTKQRDELTEALRLAGPALRVALAGLDSDDTDTSNVEAAIVAVRAALAKVTA